ncbi:MAG TPA: septum formation initiator family protein [Candidatus Paceibacterota bacterium]
MRVFVIIILSLFLVFLIGQIWNHNSQIKLMQTDLDKLQADVNKSRAEQQSMAEDFEYYSDPVNLEKELRSRFNYRGKDEKMIIIVPTSSIKTQSSTP